MKNQAADAGRLRSTAFIHRLILHYTPTTSQPHARRISRLAMGTAAVGPFRMTDDDNTPDKWSKWLLERRHGCDLENHRRMATSVERFRDRVLDGARLAPGMTLADIGTGDGLIAFGAIARIGESLNVILTDVSPPLLRHVEELAISKGIQRQCRFIQGSADKLDGLADATVDAVAVRAVLAYVDNKAAAFSEFYRVLKPGGRLSIAEPLFQDEAIETCGIAKFIEAQPNHPQAKFLKLAFRCRAAQYPSTERAVMLSPMTNYNERDLFRFAGEAGFVNVHLELHVDLRPNLAVTWETYLDTATHPLAPTLREILDEQFSMDEKIEFERTLRPVVEKGQARQKEVVAYLTAEKAPQT